MAAKRTNLSFRKLKKALNKAGYSIKSSKRRKASVKRGFEGGKRSADEIVYRSLKKNPPFKIGKFIKAKAVRVRKVGGKVLLDILR